MIPYISIDISTYSLMAVIGALAAVVYLLKRSIGSVNFPKKVRELRKLLILTVLGCIIGSRILFVLAYILNSNGNISFPEFIDVLFWGGFVFYGGLFGAVFGAILFCKTKKYDRKIILNYLMPAFALFHAFGRVGCFLGGCCYGFRLSEPIIIDRIAFNYFPIQLVEALFEFAMFLLLNKLSNKGNEIDLTVSYLGIYSPYRFIIEFFRGDEERGFLFCFSISQWISVLVIFLLIYKKIHDMFIQKKVHEGNG